jgi:Tol biopolymer transport system component
LLVPAAVGAETSAYTSAPGDVTTHSYAFGQAPMFMPDGRVVFGKDFKQGDGAQVYMVNRDGSNLRCLTCGQPAPNNVPAPRPQGDWILFHSWRGHHITIGSPGYGGMGSALYVMRPDGSKVTALTGTDPTRGAGEGEDDYHAYWSPDGRRIVYAHLNWNFVTNGGQGKWDVRVADFVDDGKSPPRLDNIRIVRPANGHWYETQWWAPDGSGFLYTETTGTAIDTELFFCRLTATGCEVKQLTNNPSWNEQALFTPDGKDIIYMSSRDSPEFFNKWAELTRQAGLTADEDYLLILPIFEAAFLQPVAEETTDLYLLDPSTGATRRLTFDGGDGWIVPEFTWDPANTHLWFTENRLPPGARVSLQFDAVKELREAADFLRNPPTPDASKAAAGDAALPVEQRTRILTFRLGSPGRPQGIADAVFASLASTRFARTVHGTRVLTLRLNVNEKVSADARLLRGRRTIARKRATTLLPGLRTLRIVIGRRVARGSARLKLTLKDAAGTTKIVQKTVQVPRR